jgi:hypothetical protein
MQSHLATGPRDFLLLTADYLGMHWGDVLLATDCHGARAPSGQA